MKFRISFVSSFSFIAMLNLSACQSLPYQPHLAKSEQLTQSRLGLSAQSFNTSPNLITAISKDNSQHPNQSGYFPLITGADAFATRSILTNLASKTIDVQYYIWHDDEAGQLMLKDLYNAANRGVKVRLLLDDLNTNPRLDQQLLAFAQHPNVAVRLMNPKKYRQFNPLNYVTALPRFGRRMHNKSMTFDQQISIIGGRNIGDEYLRSDKATQFADLDVMLVGQVVGGIDASFEQYWQNGLAYDVQTLVKPLSNQQIPFLQILDKIAPISTSPTQKTLTSASIYKKAIADSTINTDILTHRVPFRWTTIEFISDDPNKLSKKAPPDSYLVYKMREKMGEPTQAFTLISSYFVPSKQGVAELITLAKKGVKVKILTNSFSATDVGIVHSGYSEVRKPLLKAGIELYELKTSANISYASLPTNPTQPHLFSHTLAEKFAKTNLGKKFPKRLSNRQPKPLQTHSAKKRPSLKRANIVTSLHTKAFAVDKDNVFIGSYNTDPRSANINTELGVIIHDSQLASQLHNAVGSNLLTQAYQVTLDSADNLQWRTYQSNMQTQADTQNLATTVTATRQEPKMSLVNRLWIKVFSFLPIKWLL